MYCSCGNPLHFARYSSIHFRRCPTHFVISLMKLAVIAVHRSWPLFTTMAPLEGFSCSLYPYSSISCNKSLEMLLHKSKRLTEPWSMKASLTAVISLGMEFFYYTLVLPFLQWSALQSKNLHLYSSLMTTDFVSYHCSSNQQLFSCLCTFEFI